MIALSVPSWRRQRLFQLAAVAHARERVHERGFDDLAAIFLPDCRLGS
jgi:hypothetical protein